MTVEVKKELIQEEDGTSKVQKRFTPDEDLALKEGIKKYGLGRWCEMLKDKTLKFHPLRSRDAIRTRATTLGLSKKVKKNSKKVSKTSN